MLVGLESFGCCAYGRERGWMGEERIEVVDWVIVGYGRRA